MNSNGRRGKGSHLRRTAGEPVTIADVARRARVSTATVSRVLTRYPYVSEDTRRRVEAVLERLRYEPNRIARSLRVRTTQTIGLIIRESTNTKFGIIARAALQAAASRGYYVLVASSELSPDRERESIDLLLQLRVDGLALYVADERINHLAGRARLDIPVVLVESTLPGHELDEVSSDNASGAREATEYLLRLGHRRVALLHGPLTLRPCRERVEGYRAAYAAAGERPDPAMVVEVGTQERDGAEHTLRLLDGAVPPTAIFATSSALAVGVLRAVRSRGIRVPEALSVIGFDDTDATALVDPPLTVVTRDIHQIGATAMEVLLERLTGARKGPGEAGRPPGRAARPELLRAAGAVASATLERGLRPCSYADRRTRGDRAQEPHTSRRARASA